MGKETNIISSDAKLSAIASVMFFSPFVKNRINSEDFSQDEKDFISGYIQVGFVNLIFLIIVLLTALANAFEINQVLTQIINIGSLVIYTISVFSIFACVNDLGMRGPNESINQEIQNKGDLLKAYTPIANFIFWFRQENYNMPYRWLKESNLLRTVFIFGTLLLGNSFGMGVLVFIIVRIAFLLFNIDIIPLSIKKSINSMFLCNPGEIFAYLFAPIVAKLRKFDYETILQARKQGYQQGQRFGVGIIIQYILFTLLLYFIYRNSVDISSLNWIIILFALVLWVIRIIVFYIYKRTLLKIPILSEFVSLVFH